MIESIEIKERTASVNGKSKVIPLEKDSYKTAVELY